MADETVIFIESETAPLDELAPEVPEDRVGCVVERVVDVVAIADEDDDVAIDVVRPVVMASGVYDPPTATTEEIGVDEEATMLEDGFDCEKMSKAGRNIVAFRWTELMRDKLLYRPSTTTLYSRLIHQ